MSFFQPYIRRLLPIYADLEASFDRIAAMYPQEVHCKAGCDACCHVPFDIRLIEAVYVCEGIRRLPSRLRTLIRRQAAVAMEKLRASDGEGPPITRGTLSGADLSARTDVMANMRVACPALIDHKCAIYPYRPGVCRIFGVPLLVAQGQQAISCAESGFAPGGKYVCFLMSNYLKKLDAIDAEMMAALSGRLPQTACRTSVAASILVDYDVEKVRKVAVKLAGQPQAAPA